MHTIQDLLIICKKKTERGIREYGIAALMLLVGATSFGLGRLSMVEEVHPPVSIGQAPSSTASREMPLGGQFVASRTGTVYYFPWCGGAQNIKLENQRWFSSEKQAQAAGLRPAKNCKGL